MRRGLGKIAAARIVGHICLPRLYGVPISSYTEAIGSRDRTKTKLGKAFEGMSHSQEQLRVMIDTISALAWPCRPDGATEFLEQRCLDYLGHFGRSALSCQLVGTLYLQGLIRPAQCPVRPTWERAS